MQPLTHSDQATDSLNALALTKPGLIGRVVGTNKETLAAMAANITPQQLEQVTNKCSSIGRKMKARMLEQRVLFGAALHVLQQLHAGKGGGGFQRCLELANIERRNGYRYLSLFDLFGPHCVESTELLCRFSIEAAQALAAKSTPPHIQEHFIEQAKAGVDVTYRAVKHAIDSEKQRTLPPATSAPWLDRQLVDGDIKLHCTIGNTPTREQLVTAFKTALQEAVSSLPPEEPA